MYVARYLGPKNFGVLSFALAFAAIFRVFTDIGLNQLTIREVARNRSLTQKYLGNIIVLKLLLAMATFGLIALTINFLGYPEETANVVYLIALAVVLNAFNLTFYSVFQAYERMEFVSIGQILNNVLLLAVAFYAIRQGSSVVTFAFAYLLASILTLGFSAVVSSWKFARPKLEVDLFFWREALKQAMPFGLVILFSTVYYWVNSVMLSLMQGDEPVGWYNAAYRLVISLQFIPVAYFNSVFPAMSRFSISSKESLKLVFERSVKYMLLLAIPLGVGTTLLAGNIVILIYGAEYYHSVIALQILIWSLVFIFINGVFAQLLNSLNKQSLVAKVTGACALLNITLNHVLILRYGYIGASIATVSTEFVALALLFLLGFRAGYGMSGRRLIALMVRIMVAVTIMGLFTFYFRSLTLWALVPFSALLYFIALFIVKGIDREDKLLFWHIIRRREK